MGYDRCYTWSTQWQTIVYTQSQANLVRTIVCYGSSDKVTLGITALQHVRVHIDRAVCDLDVDSAHPPGAQAWKGTAVRSLRSYVSWVQYAVKQYSLYLLRLSFSWTGLQYERTDDHDTTGLSVVTWALDIFYPCRHGRATKCHHAKGCLHLNPKQTHTKTTICTCMSLYKQTTQLLL